MSSQSAARLARAAMFALEALEPRRFLSAGDLPFGQIIPIDPTAGVVQLANRYPNTASVGFSFAAKAGSSYFFSNTDGYSDIAILDQDASTVIAPVEERKGLLWTAPSDGVYFLRASDPYTGNGDEEWYSITARLFSDDFPDLKENSQPLVEGSSLIGHVDGTQDADWFAVDAEPGAVYRIDAQSLDLGGVDFSLYGPDGQLIVSRAYYDHELVFIPTESGRYYFRVGQRQDASVANLYELSLRVVRNDAPDEPASAALWDLATPLSGALDYAGDDDYFRFEAKEGDSYVFNMSGGLQGAILDSDGQEIDWVSEISSRDRVDGQLVWTAPYSGSYYFSVTPYSAFLIFVAEGDYTVRAVPVQDDARVAPIAVNQPVSGSLDRPGEFDHFSFDATEGVLYHFTIASESAPEAGYIVRVRGPESTSWWYPGTSIHTEYIFGYLSIAPVAEWIAPESGTFQIEVNAFDATRVGAYTLTMTQTLDDYGNDNAHATQLAAGEAQRGRLEYFEDEDFFSVAAVAGHSYSVALLADTPSNEFWDSGVEIYWWNDQDEQGINCYGDDGNQWCTFTADQSRDYFFPVEGYADRGYQIAANDITDRPATGAVPVIAAGAEVSFSFDSGRQVSYFRMDAQAGMTYRFLASPRTDGELNLYLVDENFQPYSPPEGTDGGWLNPGDDGEWVWKAPQSGTFFIGVAPFDQANRTQYSLALSAAENPSAEFWAEETLRADQPITGTTQHYYNPVDYIRFEAEAGTTYRFTVDASDYEAQLSIIDRDGRTRLDTFSSREVDEEGDYGYRIERSWRSPQAGTYYLAMKDGGRYVISAELVSAAPPPDEEPSVDEPADEEFGPDFPRTQIAAKDGAIEDAGALNIFKFHAIGGREYVVRTTLKTLADSTLGLFDPQANQIVAFNDDSPLARPYHLHRDDYYSSLIRWTAPRTADFDLIVGGYDEEVGSYELAIDAVGADERLIGETLGAIEVVPGADSAQITKVMDDAIYGDEEDTPADGGDVWDDSQDSRDESSDWVDSDVWDE